MVEFDVIGWDLVIYSMIYVDMVLDNVMVDGEWVVLLDFDDVGFGWYMFEFVIVFYFCQVYFGYLVICDVLFEGYEVMWFGVFDWGQLLLFLFLWGMIYFGWVYI